MSIEDRAQKLRARTFEIINTILDVPELNLRTHGPRKDWLAPPGINSFKRIDPVLLVASEDDKDWWVYDPEEYTPKVLWPFEISFILNGQFQDRHEEAIETLMIQHFRSVTPKECRGYANRISPYMVRCDHAVVDRGKWVTASGIRSYLSGQWVEASTGPIWYGRNAETAIPATGTMDMLRERRGPSLAMGIALRHRYEWAISLGFEKCPTIRFATDPTGIKELFRLRDIADGKNKRDALMTWVSDHWRQNRRDPDIEIYVRKHLRGSQLFGWRGFQCELLPSQFDVEQRDKLILEREQMRAAGEDRRLA